MGLLDRLFRGRRPPDARAARPLTAEEAVARWRSLLRTAPPDVLSEAHTRGLDSLGETGQAEVLQRLRAALSALDPGTVVPADAALLVREAARAERRAPGFLERALASDARGRTSLAGLAAAVVGSSAAAPFLRDDGPEPGADALADRRPPELDVEAPEPPGGSGGHDHDDLDDED